MKTWKDSSELVVYAARLFSKIKMPKGSANTCWEWTASTTLSNREGYGRVNFRGKNECAHRVSYEIFVGEIPDGLLVLHKCDNMKCINPFHLYAGTQAENVHDKLKRGRDHNMNKTHCKRGHPYSGKNLRIVTRTETGRTYRMCRICIAQNKRLREQKHKEMMK